jgi:hypothetical protein
MVIRPGAVWRGKKMADQPQSRTAGLEDPLAKLSQLAQKLSPQGGAERILPPVHLWNPPFCGDIGLKISRDGTWSLNNSPIRRPELVRLFSSILRLDKEGYRLVTPVEMVSIAVEDAPFVAVEMQIANGPCGQELTFRTLQDDWVRADADHRLSFETGPSGGLKPYLMVRNGLRALLSRALMLDLFKLGEIRTLEGKGIFGIASAGEFFAMAPADQIGAHDE